MEPHNQLESSSFPLGKAAVVTDRGLNPKRELNEDSYLLMPDQGLFAVADGVVGQNAGEVASRATLEIVRQHLPKQNQGDPAKALKRVIRYANRTLYEASLIEENCSGMATTLALVWLDRETAMICHVGDSRVYRLTAGELYRETVDHSLAEDPRQSGNSVSEQINRNVITRAIGVDPNVEPEFKSVHLLPETTFLLCTDGITRHLTDAEIRQMLREESDPSRLCQAFKERCYERGAKDNLTALIIRVDPIATGVSATSTRGVMKTAAQNLESGPDQLGVSPSEPTTTAPRVVSGGSPNEKQWTAHLTGGELPPGPNTSRVRTALIGLGLVVLSFVGGLYVDRAGRLPILNRLDQLLANPGERAYNSGVRKYQSKRYVEAERDFERAVSLDRSRGPYVHWLGRTQLMLNKYADAAGCFERAASLGGGAENYLLEATARQAAGDTERAKIALEEFRRRSVSDGR